MWARGRGRVFQPKTPAARPEPLLDVPAAPGAAKYREIPLTSGPTIRHLILPDLPF
jgi:hypothetical protein